MEKYVYLMECVSELNSAKYKIGISLNPEKRISQLQTGNPDQLKLIDKYKSDIAERIEKTIHRQYSYLKKEGEWFDLNIDDIQNFNKNCKRIETNLKLVYNQKLFYQIK